VTSDASHSIDVLIVGGGPSGAAAGKLLAERGLSVVIVDKCTFPRPKPCGGYISGRCSDAARHIFGADVIVRTARATTTGCRMFDRGTMIADVDDVERVSIVHRPDFDAELLTMATAAGCEVRQGTEVTELDPAAPAVRLSDGERLAAKFVIGADGVGSFVRNVIRPGRPSPHQIAFGLVADVPPGLLRPELREGCSTMPHIYFGAVPWGYGWIFPKGDCVSIGIAGAMSKTRNFREPMDAFIGDTCVAGAGERIRPGGHRIPFGNFEWTPGRGNVLLLGDAAGFAEPLTGEGLAFALESGEIAADAICDALHDGAPQLALRRYARNCRWTILSTLIQGRLARRVFYPPWCHKQAMKSLARSPDRVRDFLKLLSGEMNYFGLFGRGILDTVLRVLRRA
jgi:geranylgeranyl reductase family protein